VEHPTRSNQTTATERRVLIKLKNTVETDGKGKEGAHDPTQRTSTSPGPCGAISRLGRTGVAGPATEAVGRAAVVATLASSSRGWSCGPFPGLLRCPCPGRRRCPRRRRRPPCLPSLPASAVPTSASARGAALASIRAACATVFPPAPAPSNPCVGLHSTAPFPSRLVRVWHGLGSATSCRCR
jgi:hypothetical protein